MKIHSTSLTISTTNMMATRKFYETHFGAHAIFDCGWYVVLQLGFTDTDTEICLMEPQDGSPSYGGGITLNILVEDADVAHAQFIKAGISTTIPLADHSWGDRGFGVVDPSGVIVYCYHPITPSEEYIKFFVRSH